MSSRPLLSRPRTRVYDANYNIGESYYKSALDRLDRKYSGRPLSPPPRQPSLPENLLDRHERAFADEDLPSFRRRAEKRITENNLFDSRGGRISARAFDLMENDIDEETAASLKRIRANKKVTLIDDVDLESTVNNLKSRRMLDKSEKLLDTVGVNESSRRALDEDVSVKRRSLRVVQNSESGVGSSELTKWTPLAERDEESAAAVRARKSRARINDIEEEMAAMSERQAARERRVARLKALVAENDEEAEAQAAMQSVRISARREKKTVEF